MNLNNHPWIRYPQQQQYQQRNPYLLKQEIPNANIKTNIRAHQNQFSHRSVKLVRKNGLKQQKKPIIFGSKATESSIESDQLVLNRNDIKLIQKVKQLQKENQQLHQQNRFIKHQNQTIKQENQNLKQENQKLKKRDQQIKYEISQKQQQHSHEIQQTYQRIHQIEKYVAELQSIIKQHLN